MNGIENLIWVAERYGVFEFYLPFVLVFSLVFGLLEKAKIFGERSKNINVVISLVFAFYILIYTPAGLTMAEFFANYVGGTATILVTGLAFLMIFFLFMPMFGIDQLKGKDIMKPLKYLVVFAALLAFGIYLNSGGSVLFPGIDIGGIGFLGLSSQDIALIALLVLTVLVIWWMSREEKGTSKLSNEELAEEVQRRRGG